MLILMPMMKKFMLMVFLTVLCSCGHYSKYRETMDECEVLMEERPDSVLFLLDSIHSDKLRGNKDRARYALLYSMAQNKNFIDITSDSVIMPAVRYYEKHGSKDDKMKTSYYLGVVRHNSGDLESAIENYIRARELSSYSVDLSFKGLISSTISDVYRQNKNYFESLRYAHEALDLFTEAKDSARAWNMTGALTALYDNIGDYEKADSLYSVFFSYPCRDSSIYSRILLNAAISCLWKQVPEPSRNIELFHKAVNEFNGNPKQRDYCAYAYAWELLGNRSTADDILAQLEEQGAALGEIDTWRYRICRHRGEYKEALDFLERSVRERDAEVFTAVNQSVALAQSDYYQFKSESLAKERRIQNQRYGIFVLSTLVIVLCLLVIYMRARAKWASRMEYISRLNDNLNNLLSREHQMSEEYRQRLDVVEERQSRLVDREAAVEELRSKYIRAFKSQLDKLNILCAEYWESGGTNWNKDRIYEKVREIASELEDGGEDKLEAMIDEALDGIMSKLNEDIPRMSKKDRKFIMFQILGFDAKTISRATGYSVSSVYTKRNSLKKILMELDSENRNLYLEVML